MANYEIEIKSLIGDKRKADELVSKMKLADPGLVSVGKHKQMNHYFVGGNLAKLKVRLNLELPFQNPKDASVRTRWADGRVILVIKATVDDTTSSNGTARQEFEKVMNLTLEQLDKALLDCGFEYQAKWSREREEYQYKNMNVSIDKNAGYGYLVEFESVITDLKMAEQTKTDIRDRMKELAVEELPQDRLERMFDYYNKHWQDYYGTEKVFNIA
ncbi:MAG: CYTH domain-containing protein [Candidatus Doudnabacteria bacterium]